MEFTIRLQSINDYCYYVIVKIKLHRIYNLRSDLKPACCSLHFGVQEVIFYAKIYFYLKQTCSGLCKQTLLNQNAVLSKRSATAQQSEEGAQKSAILVGDSNLGGRGAQPTWLTQFMTMRSTPLVTFLYTPYHNHVTKWLF